MKNIEYIKVGDIKPHIGSHNSDSTVALIKESIEKYGFQEPIIVDKNFEILAGNAVYKAAVQCGMEEIPCIVERDLSDEKAKQYRIADNKTSEFARWNERKLKQELSYLEKPSDLQFCFDMSINNMLGLNVKPAPVYTEKPKNKNGQPSKVKFTEEEKDEIFRQQLQEVEKSIAPKAPEYITYVCTRCGKTVSIKK